MARGAMIEDWCSADATKERSPRVTRSPRAAAIGVATLSGLTLNLRDADITSTMTRPRVALAREAVTTLLVARTSTLFKANFSGLASQAMLMAKHAASQPTTMPCTCSRAKLAMAIATV